MCAHTVQRCVCVFGYMLACWNYNAINNDLVIYVNVYVLMCVQYKCVWVCVYLCTHTYCMLAYWSPKGTSNDLFHVCICACTV